GNETADQNFWKDLKTNTALFLAMRGMHLGSAAFGEKVLATGKLGKWAGSPVAGESAGALRTLPTKQMVWMPSGNGSGVPQLTVAGERVVGALNHGGALAAMYYTPRAVNGIGGWFGKPNLVDAPGLDDTFLMYIHAMAGYNISNAATGGRLNMGLASLNMRMRNLEGAHSVEGIKQQISELNTEKKNLEASKEGLNDSAKSGVDGKIHKLDGQVLNLKKKLRKAEQAAKPAAELGAPKAKAEQGDLVQLFESKPEQLILADAANDSTLAVRPLKAGEEIPLDSHLLGREGSDLVLKRDAEGKLTLHDNQKANAEPDSANGEPVPAPATVQHNGKDVTGPVVLAEGDVISVSGKEVRIGIASPSPLEAVMAQVPRAQQLSLARQIGKAKKISDLFKRLRDSAHGGAGEVMMITAEVLAGRRTVESLPTQLGLRAKVRSLIEGQVKEWKNEGLSVDGHALKEGVLPKEASNAEVEYHTLRAVIALKSGVESSRTMFDLLQALGQSTLQTVGGVSTKQIFDSLGLEQKRGFLDQITKTEAGLREKIRLLERGINRQKKSWRKTDKELIEVQEKNRDEMLEKAEGLKALIELLKAEVEAGDAATAAGEGRKLADIIQDLPRELGIRQKAQDAFEQSLNAVYATTYSEKEKADFLKIAKRFLGASAEVDFPQAQTLLRSLLDNGNWQGNLLLGRLKPAELELAMKVYFGSATGRNLSPEQAFSLANALSRTPLKENFGIVLSQSEGSSRLDLVRSEKGDFTAQTSKDGNVMLLVTHPTGKSKELEIGRQELIDFVEQAKKDWNETGGSARTMARSSRQLSDSQLYFDPETRSYQTWIADGRGLSKVRVTLDPNGEVESIQVKYAPRPGENKRIAAKIPASLAEYQGKDGAAVPVEKQAVEYQALAKELPFEVKGPTWAYRALRQTSRISDGVRYVPSRVGDGAAWVGSKIPRPRFSKPAAKNEPAKPVADAKPATGSSERSFARGAMALLGKIPGFGPRKPKVDPKPAPQADSKPAPTQPEAQPVPPPNAPKSEGVRPTLPDGL
ncbi:MAG TPA: hypothetical protein VJR29_14410, partial [bacterium]|nr:hypothetical protein [bacterium]